MVVVKHVVEGDERANLLMNCQIPAFGKTSGEIRGKGRMSDDERWGKTLEGSGEVGKPSLPFSLHEGVQIVPVDINAIVAVLLGVGCHCSCAGSWIDVVSRGQVDGPEYSKH